MVLTLMELLLNLRKLSDKWTNKRSMISWVVNGFCGTEIRPQPAIWVEYGKGN